MKQGKKGSQFNNDSTVPFITSEGLQATIKKSAIPESGWTHCHGQGVSGEIANSIRFQPVGKSVLLGNTAGGPMLSATQVEAEVFARQYLLGIGYTVSAPQVQQVS